jgi:hypothetical protein
MTAALWHCVRQRASHPMSVGAGWRNTGAAVVVQAGRVCAVVGAVADVGIGTHCISAQRCK